MGADSLGLEETVTDPLNNQSVLNMIECNRFDDIQAAMLATTPESPTVSFECQLSIKGQPRWYQVVALCLWSDGDSSERTGFIGKAFDINESRLKREELEHQATHDTLTGLLNSTSAKEQISRLLKANPEKKYVMAIFDLDTFKSINDTYGHLFGDRILKQTADSLQKCADKNSICARMGGDEFLVLLENPEDKEKTIESIFNSVKGCYDGVQVCISMGIAESSAVCRDYYSLFHAADEALYFAKRLGKNRYSFYNDSMQGTLTSMFPNGNNN